MSTKDTRTIVGNLTTDPELRYTAEGKAVTDVKVAVNLRARTDDGEWVEAGTDYYDVAVWEREAENAAESLRKGTRITVTGEIYRRAWTDNDGVVRISKKIKATSPIGVALDFQTAEVAKANGNRQNGGAQ